MKLAATYFDGCSSTRHPVAVVLAGRELVVHAASGDRRYAIDVLDVGECLDGGPLWIRMPDGAACEIEQGPAFEAMLATAGRRPPLIVALQRHAAWALAALVLVIGLVFAGYRWGLPWFAERLAPHLPAQAVEGLGTRVLVTLDRQTLKPSRLKAERLDALRARLEQFAQTTALPTHQLLFRSAPALGANAFALPGGKVVVLDRLVDVASDDQVVAVIAHELGHVAHNHAMRRLIQDAVVSTVVASYLGDFSTAAASATALALNAGYSREFELQADRYAAERLREAGRDPLELIALLEKISHRGGSGASALASHPDVAARANAIRRFVAARPPYSSHSAQP